MEGGGLGTADVQGWALCTLSLGPKNLRAHFASIRCLTYWLCSELDGAGNRTQMPHAEGACLVTRPAIAEHKRAVQNEHRRERAAALW
jgi:hypothetical protein